MRKRWPCLFLLILLTFHPDTGLAAAPAAAAAPAKHTTVKSSAAPETPAKKGVVEARVLKDVEDLFKYNDYLGLRSYLKKIAEKNIPASSWVPVRKLLAKNVQNIGQDMISLWDNRNPLLIKLQGKIFTADDALLAEKSNEAFYLYQGIARSLKNYKKKRPQSEEFYFIYPYILHAMGRALFTSARFQEAWAVYEWIPADYPRFKQVLFEKMWTAFRQGKTDLAIGAVASQKSTYLSLSLHPESYLVLGYVFRKLCRTDDFNALMRELSELEKAVREQRIAVWAEMSPETKTLYQLSKSKIPPKTSRLISRADRENERKNIASVLQAAFSKYGVKLVEQLKTMKSYLSLSKLKNTVTALSPVIHFAGREELLDQGLEIWPVDEKEEWADEVGKHIYLGESLCKSADES